MTTPFNYTQFLYGPSSLLENGAESFYTMNASGESEVSGEVVFYQRVDPGFAGDVRSFQANLNFRFKFDNLPSFSSPVFVGSGRDDLSVSYGYDLETTADEITYEVYIQKKSGTIDEGLVHIGRPAYYGSGDTYEILVDGGSTYHSSGEIPYTIHHSWYSYTFYRTADVSFPGGSFRFSSLYGHTSGDSWKFSAKSRRLEFEWFGRSSGEDDWIPLGEPSKRVSWANKTNITTTPRVSVLEMDGDKFPKVPLDIKLEISRVFNWAGSGDLHISFVNDEHFFASVTGDA